VFLLHGFPAGYKRYTPTHSTVKTATETVTKISYPDKIYGCKDNQKKQVK
jgi:hypothetical protein